MIAPQDFRPEPRRDRIEPMRVLDRRESRVSGVAAVLIVLAIVIVMVAL